MAKRTNYPKVVITVIDNHENLCNNKCNFFYKGECVLFSTGLVESKVKDGILNDIPVYGYNRCDPCKTVFGE